MQIEPPLDSVSTPISTEPSPKLRVAMLARLVGIQLTAAMVILGIPAVTPALREEFTLSRAGAGLLMTAAFLGVVAGSWPAGRAVDAIGVRRAMLMASGGLGVSLAILGVAPSYAAVLVVLFVVGLFYSPVTPATNVGVVAWAPSGFRTRGMAIKQMGVSAGAAISAALIPLLTAGFGWRIAVVFVGVLVAVAGVLSAQWFRRPAEARALARRGRLENRPLVVSLGVATLLLLLVQHSVSTHYILALQDRGVALVAAGGALSLLQVSATGARYGWAWISDRRLRGNTPLAVLISCFASAVVLSGMTLFDGTHAPAVAAVFLGLTTQAANGLMQLILSDSGGGAPASSTGLGMSIGFSGTVIGPPLFGFLADTWTYRSSWIVLAAVSLGAGVITWRASRAISH
jgi:MFS transporter, ACS family, hexuronate transporter